VTRSCVRPFAGLRALTVAMMELEETCRSCFLYVSFANDKLHQMPNNPAETPHSQEPKKIGLSRDNSRENVDRKISVAPMMDCTKRCCYSISYEPLYLCCIRAFDRGRAVQAAGWTAGEAAPCHRFVVDHTARQRLRTRPQRWTIRPYLRSLRRPPRFVCECLFHGSAVAGTYLAQSGQGTNRHRKKKEVTSLGRVTQQYQKRGGR
jgi:hypothetical protein